MENTASELPFLDFETVDVPDDDSCASDLSDFDVMEAGYYTHTTFMLLQRINNACYWIHSSTTAKEEVLHAWQVHKPGGD